MPAVGVKPRAWPHLAQTWHTWMRKAGNATPDGTMPRRGAV